MRSRVQNELIAVWVGEKIKFPTPPAQVARKQAQGTTRRTRKSSHRQMDITWLTDRIAVGGGIWTADNMAAVAREGITHIIDMQIAFDDTPLAAEQGIKVLWNPTDDDFEAKPAELFQCGVDFAQDALQQNGAKVFIHCAAGVHRAPMMALALLCASGWELEDARDLIEARRPVADFADVYVQSVEKYLEASAKPSDPWSI
jgi:protein-tyrosine phosphatase